tara:strand:- start:1215 stop:2657 length:1443 start_codon:yes stop_codon:yes gene_type:complete
MDNVAHLRLYHDKVISEDKYTNENSLSNALLRNPSLLSPVMTFLAGREDKRFPLSFLTEGGGAINTLDSIDYHYPVIGKLSKAMTVAENYYTSGDKPGIGHSPFKIKFTERWSGKQMILESPKTDMHARIIGDPVKDGDGWVYTLELSSRKSSDFVPLDELTVGSKWAKMFAPVAPYGSRGNDSPAVAPSKLTNMITHIRKSYGYKGNIPNTKINVEITLDSGETTTLWWDFEEWQHMLAWKEECESLLWWGRYNKDENGIIHLKDDNGVDIPIGSGLAEQIPNVDTYAQLTTNKLKSIMRDVFFGANDAQAQQVVLYTGTGGMEEFDNALKQEMNRYNQITGDKFVTGTGRGLTLTGYFRKYEHVDGHSVTLVNLPALDKGPRANKAPLHPITGLPLTSYEMYFIDQSVYDGQSNLQMVTQKGREMIRWAVAGSTVPPGYTGNDTRASDIDGASVHFMKAAGIQLMRATNCLKLKCTIS